MRTQAVSERFKIGPVPISKDGGATRADYTVLAFPMRLFAPPAFGGLDLRSRYGTGKVNGRLAHKLLS
jgi:hypothetical protein